LTPRRGDPDREEQMAADMARKSSYDVIVLGGGTMGTAAAWVLARRGIGVLVIEQFRHVHDQGAHGGETRIIRHAYAESPEYVPLVQRADALWTELEGLTGTSVLVRCGGLELAAPGHDHARSARLAADEHDLPYEWLSPAEASRRWPEFTRTRRLGRSLQYRERLLAHGARAPRHGRRGSQGRRHDPRGDPGHPVGR
jgi:glycine/D-amino acid oxidase-like deaminating enzyme